MLNLKGGEEEIYEELGEAQADGRVRGLVCYEDEDHVVDAQQRDQGQRRLGQPETWSQGGQMSIQKDEREQDPAGLTGICNRCISSGGLEVLTPEF